MVYKCQSIYSSSSLRNSSLSERLEQFSSSIYYRSPTQLLMYSRPLSTCGIHYHLNKVIPWCLLLTLQLWCIVLAHLSFVLLLLSPLVIVSRINSRCLLVLHWLFFSYYHQARSLQEQILRILLWNATKIHTVDAFMHCSYWSRYRCYNIRFKSGLSFNSLCNIWSVNAVQLFWINTTASDTVVLHDSHCCSACCC
jgi:hypothetical protein